MKIAVVYYSFDGNCALVAEEIKAQCNADLIRLCTKDEKKRGKLASMFWGGGMVLFRKNPPLKPYTFDPSAYDLIIFGAPVWAGHPAPPVRTFLSETGIAGKKTALFVCHGGGMGSALKKFQALLAGNDIIGGIDFEEPSRGNGADKAACEELKQKIANWVKGFSG